jgi:hypothetical protein
MIVYDTPRRTTYRHFRSTAHCGSTLPGAEGTAELLAFGRQIGLREAWLQRRGDAAEHFDLFDGRIAAATEAGAEQITPREFIARVVQPKRAPRSPR